jgi:hypothetical protein
MATMSREAVRSISAGRNDMKRICAGFAVAAVMAFGGRVLVTTATAAPPTVTPSPGYDARLQESRARAAYEPAVRIPRPVTRHRAKRIHGAY